MKPRILILADDLSGAADCALSCLAAGMDTVVALDGEAPPPATALAIDTDSRRMDRSAAADVTAGMLKAHAGADTLIYKKIDSTLRGHFAAELASSLALHLRGGAHKVAIVAPAFPAAGRTTRGGQQYLHGEKVEDTAVWRNENLPGRASLPELLMAANLRVAQIGLDAVRGENLAQTMRDAAHAHDALACDAETDDDLAAIAAAGQGTCSLWAGSAGLAHHLPRAAGLALEKQSVPQAPRRSGAVICAVGSLSEISREQFLHLARADVADFILPPTLLRAGPDAREWWTLDAAILAAIEAGRDIAVMIDSAPGANPKEGLELCAALGRLLAPHLATARGLIATGGETARALLLAAGVPALRLAAEVEPGIPLSIASGAAASLHVITKAGAFGNVNTLHRCRNMLRNSTFEGVSS